MPSEPSPSLRSDTQKEKRHHYDAADKEIEEYQRRLGKCQILLKRSEEEKKSADEKAQKEIEALKIRLYHSVKEAKKYEEAERLYHEIVTEKGLTTSDDPKIHAFKSSFVGMLMEQAKFEEAEPISRSVWEKRKGPSDDWSDEAKQSHRQLCSILRSLKRFDEVENMHRTMYHKATKDAWALENGDDVCQILAEQKKYENAKTMQHDVWIERQRQLGRRDERTIRTGARVIEFIEKLIACTGHRDGSDAQRRLSNTRKKAFEDEYEVYLGDIWDTQLHPEPYTEILDAGHKLGNVHFLRKAIPAAKDVFERVWEGKKLKYGEDDASTLSTASLLGKVLRSNPETVPRAIEIFHDVWLARKATTGSDDLETIVSGEDLAQAYHSVLDLANAESMYKWIMDRKAQKYGRTAPETVAARWILGQILYKQGALRNREAVLVLGELYHYWRQSSPRSVMTLQCGSMLAWALSNSDDNANEALGIIRGVFNEKIALGQRDLFYLESGRLLGRLLLKVENIPEAEAVLESLWGFQVNGPEEDRAHLICGTHYGRCLFIQQKYSDAQKVLEIVAGAQGHPNGDPQIAETHALLRDVDDKIKEAEIKAAPKEKDKEKEKEKGKGGNRTKRRGLWS